jgi:hypothetical protein
MSRTSKINIDLDRIDGANINLMGARAILRIIESTFCEDDPIVKLGDVVIAEALHGVGLLLDAARDSLNGGDDD